VQRLGIGLLGHSGMGLAKYAQLQAVLELARRALGEEMAHRDVLDSPPRCATGCA
jgi:DNA repair protein RadC